MARVTARFADVVDFPSSGSALDTTKTRLSWSTSTYCMLVRSTRNDSAHGVASASAVAIRFLAAAESALMWPRMGAWSPGRRRRST